MSDKKTPPAVLTKLDISEERSKTGCYAHGDQATIQVMYAPGMSYLLCQRAVDELFMGLSSHISKEMYDQLKTHFLNEK